MHHVRGTAIRKFTLKIQYATRIHPHSRKSHAASDAPPHHNAPMHLPPNLLFAYDFPSWACVCDAAAHRWAAFRETARNPEVDDSLLIATPVSPCFSEQYKNNQ
ncbi:hypothetical protein [Desulfoluna spongiiphila]|uniref:hypothetical protein n=1 Tax=Desulfoluna spongiiphila TaxID=419481 RepID=UPI00125F8015|nr:hypothetical protein [Desulfoluna spongiiphila]